MLYISIYVIYIYVNAVYCIGQLDGTIFVLASHESNCFYTPFNYSCVRARASRRMKPIVGIDAAVCNS